GAMGKVDPADVNLLVEELELSKAKATELLKAHDGDAIKAMKAYIQPAFGSGSGSWSHPQFEK
uniref:Putative uncharacterized protein n=1 Tax=Chaetomium thermophilum (strain DSM 1495 / CBS 144.50 / IMI 039719) TaxID=759272 RepID=UPI000B4235CC|nr:Chain C, Structure of Naa15/Naa10 bound to HypK-THB [Thermochaetoides thermophila DSM 1495]5NNP_G Chain G, Structure of Naa15/Naa10 bound to HypK-THB [Thermochaetoides thermophila DSM 1495]